jgi:hypothetical protein
MGNYFAAKALKLAMFITRSHRILTGCDIQKFTEGVPNVREECVSFVNITLTDSITVILGLSQMLSNASDALRNPTEI